MIPHWLERTELLVGPEALKRVLGSHVLVVGLGGVGSFAVEFLARSGVGRLTLVDGDVVDPTNRNRQLQALSSSHGQKKAWLLRDRVRDINPECHVEAIDSFLDPEAMRQLLQTAEVDFALDCIDSVQPKLNFIRTALNERIPFISSMGAGGRVDPSKIQIAPLQESYNCPFAKHVRKRLQREYGIRKGFPVVFSSELANKDSVRLTDGSNFKKSFYGTSAWIPAAFGLHVASYTVRQLMARTE
ncbi:MAG: tRNA threonylcarbamoyladenosine dehydratase [Bacteroidetes bacterium]|nr:tRNA threonylcarbamoyladenosine dehydratase [Bacteroidota bacterium]